MRPFFYNNLVVYFMNCKVEQLHKIFKMCGTPSDEYWTKTRHPLAAMFKPQFTYESSLHERCKELPRTVVDLIDQLLCVEPEKRVTANSALQVEVRLVVYHF